MPQENHNIEGKPITFAVRTVRRNSIRTLSNMSGDKVRAQEDQGEIAIISAES